MKTPDSNVPKKVRSMSALANCLHTDVDALRAAAARFADTAPVRDGGNCYDVEAWRAFYEPIRRLPGKPGLMDGNAKGKERLLELAIIKAEEELEDARLERAKKRSLWILKSDVNAAILKVNAMLRQSENRKWLQAAAEVAKALNLDADREAKVRELFLEYVELAFKEIDKIRV
jgi:hypothetical protein